MEELKSAALMDEWKNYCNGNVDIFEFINRSISVAASNHPTEFLIQRNKIAETLFSSELIKSSESKKPSNMVSCETDDQTKNVGKVVRMNEILDKSGDRSEAMEQRPKMVLVGKKLVILKGPETHEKKVKDNGAKEVEEVLRIKKILDKGGDESESVVCDSLRKLQDMGLSMKTLEATGVGKSVSLLRKHASKNVCQIAATLVKAWRAMVDEWIEKESPTSMQLIKPTYVKKMNTEKKLGGSEKIGVMDFSEKLEATKRKLREGYEKVENMKRQRRVQVMELHEVTKQGLLSQKRPLLNNYRRKGFSRRC